jgi:tetratricopeptide (TPR) repeat protein
LKAECARGDLLERCDVQGPPVARWIRRGITQRNEAFAPLAASLQRVPRRTAHALAASIVLATTVAGTCAHAEETAPMRSWATARAESLTLESASLLAAGRALEGLERLREALVIDATYGPAYLRLAEAREAMGEPREALAILALGLSHVPELWEARARRARLHLRIGTSREALGEVREALALRPDEPAVLELVLVIAPRERELALALAAARRLVALRRARGDANGAREVQLTAIALTRLVAEADPVAAGRDSADPVRRMLGRAALRSW